MVTGFWAKPGDKEKVRFLEIWLRNTSRQCDPADIFILNVSDRPLGLDVGNWINVGHNLGHVGDLDLRSPDRRLQLGGWAAGYMLGALIAYSREADFIYKEQDCLAFGPWVDRMYQELDSTNAKMLVGRFDHHLQIEQSLTIVKHEFITTLVREYLAIPTDDSDLRPELKFLRIMEKHSEHIRFLSFGFGRNRPLDLDAPVFYCQHLTNTDLEAMKKRGLI